jgi:hypothetical protein
MALVLALSLPRSLERVPQRVHGGCEVGELLEVQFAERF